MHKNLTYINVFFKQNFKNYAEVQMTANDRPDVYSKEEKFIRVLCTVSVISEQLFPFYYLAS